MGFSAMFLETSIMRGMLNQQPTGFVDIVVAEHRYSWHQQSCDVVCFSNIFDGDFSLSINAAFQAL
jgi:hypothetical protein